MNQSKIIEIQTRIGTTPDGFWGPASIAACQRHLRALMPHPNPWPNQSQAALERFYGPPGESHLVNLRVADLPVYYEGERVKTIRVNLACAESLRRVLEAISDHATQVLAKFDGVFNNRPMRNGSLPSLHARGAAIDLDAGPNGNLVSWPVKATMPLDIMEDFAREGWLSAGAFWGRDAMHFQATV